MISVSCLIFMFTVYKYVFLRIQILVYRARSKLLSYQTLCSVGNKIFSNIMYKVSSKVHKVNRSCTEKLW